MNTSASANTRGAFLKSLVAEREVCRICSVCKVFLGGDPEGELSHGLCELDFQKAMAEVEAYKQQQQQGEIYPVPSASFDGQHQVKRQADGSFRCTCTAASYGRLCRHVKVAREARRQKISVTELLRRLGDAKAKGWCGLPTCSSCAGSFYMDCPRSAGARAAFNSMMRGEEIGRQG